MDEILTLLYALFDGNDWVDTATYPDDYLGDHPADAFCRFSLVSNSNPLSYQLSDKRTAALLQFKIFTPTGHGRKDAYAIAAAMDNALERLSLAPGVSLGVSSVSDSGTDSDDPTLLVTEYSIPITLYKGLS